jgi:hypothetical protein
MYGDGHMSDGFTFDWKSRDLKRTTAWPVAFTYFDEEIGHTVTRYKPAYAQTDDLSITEIGE